MAKKKRKLEEAMMESKGKKVMKRDRTGRWVVALLLGLMVVGYTPEAVGAEQSQEQVTEIEEVSEREWKQSNSSNAVIWVANSPVQVTNEIEKQSDEKDQDPLTDYTIIWGDTLWAISQATGTTVEELAAINNIDNPDLIYAGDLLTLVDGTIIEITPEHSEGVTSVDQETSETDIEDTVQDLNTGQEGQIIEPEAPVEAPADDQVIDNSEQDEEIVEDEDTGNFQPTDPIPTPEEPTEEDNGEVTDREEVIPDDEPIIEETDPVPAPGDNNGEVEVEEPSETPVDPEEDTEVDVTDPEVQEPENDEEVIVTTQVETVTEQLGYTIIRRGTADLPVGQERVIQEGNFGQRVQEFLVTFHDGIQIGEKELISDTVTIEPVDRIVEFGTYIEPETTVTTLTETANLSFERVTIENPTMWEGDSEVVQAGSFGQIEREYRVTYRDGVEINRELMNENTIVQPVDEIIHVGTMPTTSIEIRTDTEVLPFETIERNNPELAVGEQRIVQEGVNGVRTNTYEQLFEKGEFVGEELVETEITTAPITRIIEVGVETGLDLQLFAQEMLTLINELRASVGVAPLRYDDTLQAGTNIRANEVSEVFSHTRPDGRHFITAFGYEEPNYYLGENIAINHTLGFSEDENITLEKYMAELFFNQYYNSPGHYNNMVSESYVTFATGARMYGENSVSNVQIFGSTNR